MQTELCLLRLVTEVPPINSASGNLVKSVFEKENGLEEAVFGRADHRISEAGGGRRAGQGAMSPPCQFFNNTWGTVGPMVNGIPFRR